MIKSIKKEEGCYFRCCLVVLKEEKEYLVTGGNYEGTIIIFDIKNNWKIINEIKGHYNFILENGLCYSKKKNYLITGNEDKRVKIWDFDTLNLVKIIEDVNKLIYCVTLIEEEDKMIVGRYDEKISIYCLNTFNSIKTIETDYVCVFDFVLLDKKKFISVGFGGKAKFWNYETGDCLKTLNIEDQDLYYSIKKDRSKIIVGSKDSELFEINSQTFEVKTFSVMKDYVHHQGINSFLLLSNGNFLCSTDCIVKLINGNTYECLKTVKLSSKSKPGECYIRSIVNSVEKYFFYSVFQNFIYVFSMKEKNQIEDENERLDYLLSEIENDYDLKINLKNSKTILCYKSLIPGMDNNVSVIKLDEELDIDNEKVIKILFGVEFDVPDSLLFDYYVFFHTLKVFNHSFLICERIKYVNDLKLLIELFSCSFKRYETKDKNFTCPFTIEVCKCLKSQKERIINDTFLENNLLSVVDIYELKSCVDYSTTFKLENNVERLFSNRLEQIYCEKYHNFKVISNDKVEFLTEKEILIFSSTFFYKMCCFKGVESNEMKVKRSVVVHGLNGKELKFFLDFIFTSFIDTDDLSMLSRLLNFAEMYFEYDLKFYLFEKIKHLTKPMVDNDELIEELKNFGYLIESEEIMEMFVYYWLSVDSKKKKKKLTKQLIMDCIKESKHFPRLQI